MNDNTPPQTARPRTHLFVVAATALVLVGGGAVGYAVVAQDDRSACEGLLTDTTLQRSLGDAYRENMDCDTLGRAIEDAATGSAPGRHTLPEARTMQATLAAVSEDIEQREEPSIPSDLRAPLAAALADYAQDTYEILSGVNGDYTRRADSAPWQDGKTVRMSAHLDDLVNVLRAVSEAPAAYADVRAAHVRTCATRLAAVPSQATGSVYTGPARSCAVGLGYYDGIVDDVPKSQASTWRSGVLQRLKATADSFPPYEVNRAQHIAGSWQQAVLEQVDSDQTQFLKDDSSRIVGIWTGARGEGIDSKKVNDLELTIADDANSSAMEAEQTLQCTRHPTECG
ncbi:hypothetical protein [Streptomyces chartreusis]|uniref:hypothetical protein n=1 Tax=Streptomyces chartreusis TaxID=1969 RepID=UPI002E802080|nr:hypothetical protein [Streptomyces chartreusis]WUB23085.1 hypothetical protein OG997_43140 [Streptomyces chartreusis]